MNVLLLDDEPLELEQLEFLIHSHFPMWKLHAVETGKAAIALAEQVRFPLAFIDVKLRGSSGLEVADQLRTMGAIEEIIVVSAYQDFQYAKQSIHLGVLDYLVKPVLDEDVARVLQKFADKHPELVGTSDLIQQLLKKIHTHYNEKLHLSDLAKEFHISASYLSKRFGDELGISFSDYVIQYRIDMAKQLLAANRDWSITRVSEAVGFNSSHYFSKMFKKLTSQSPKEFRRTHG